MGFKPRTRLGLADEWRRWIAEALHGGAEPRTVVDELVASGAPRSLAMLEVDTIATAISSLSGRLRRAELALDLTSSLKRLHELETRTLCDRATFVRHYLSTHTPVAFSDVDTLLGVADTWTPRYLLERAGDCTVRVSANRDADPRHYVHPEREFSEMRLADLVERIEHIGRAGRSGTAGSSNDLYMVSRNRALEGPMGVILDDIVAVPEFLRQDSWRRAVSLWLGPAGTHTPLHHDTSHILFCQIYGTKHLRLVQASEPGLLFGSNHATFYTDVDPVETGARIHDITVTPGMGVYIPLGWWHQVDALEPSISLSFTGFADARADDSYRPGQFSM